MSQTLDVLVTSGALSRVPIDPFGDSRASLNDSAETRRHVGFGASEPMGKIKEERMLQFHDGFKPTQSGSSRNSVPEVGTILTNVPKHSHDLPNYLEMGGLGKP